MKTKKASPNLKINQPMRISLIGLVVITLILSTSFNDPFNTSKFIALIVFSSLLTGYLIIDSKLWMKFQSDLLIYSAFLFGLIIAFTASDNKYIAFFGDIQRKNGFLCYLCLLLYSFAVSIFFESSHYKQFSKLVIFLAILFIPYGILQLNKNDFFRWNNPYNPIILTLGNPNFASSMMAVLSILIFGFMMFSKERLNQWFYVFLIFGLLFNIYKSNSRQGLIVFGIGILLILSFKFNEINVKYGFLSFLFTLIIFAFGVLGLAKIGPLQSIMYKGSIGVRSYYWRAALKMFFESPITGVGLDRFQYNFKLFRDPQYPLDFGYQITSSNAHNVVLQLFATGGLLVGLPYVFLVIYIGSKFARNLLSKSSNQKSFYDYSIFSAWIGFQAQSLISIDNIGLSIWGWVLTGIMFARIKEIKGSDNWLQLQSRTISKTATVGILSASFLGLVALIFSSIIYNGESAALKSRSALNPNGSNNPNIIQSLGNKVLETKFVDPYYKIEVARNYLNVGLAKEGIGVLQDIIKNDSKNLEALETLGYALESQGSFQEAIKYRRILEKLDPFGVPNMLRIGLDLKQIGEKQAMLEIRQKILSIAPNGETAKTALETLN